MKWEIKKWFGRPIFITKLENYQQLNQEISELINKEVKPTNSQFARTTDVRGDTPLQDITDNLHWHPKFKNLFTAIEEQLNIFFKAHNYQMDIFDPYITKAWATFSTKGQYISGHKHTSSHYSLVYYVEAEEQGNICFEEDGWHNTGMYIPTNDTYFRDWNEVNFASVKYPSESGGLIIFPSNLTHFTEENTKERPRISISADVLLTMKNGVVSEHCLPSPETWRKIC